MTGHDRQQIEARLDARLKELTRTRDAVGPVPGPDHADVVNHPADLAGDLHDREVDAGTRLLWQEEETRIAEARQALASGTYGTCLTCGQQIAAAAARGRARGGALPGLPAPLRGLAPPARPPALASCPRHS